MQYGQIEKTKPYTKHDATINDQQSTPGRVRQSAMEQECQIHGERAYSLSFMYLTKDFLCTRPTYCPFWRTQR